MCEIFSQNSTAPDTRRHFTCLGYLKISTLCLDVTYASSLYFFAPRSQKQPAIVTRRPPPRPVRTTIVCFVSAKYAAIQPKMGPKQTTPKIRRFDPSKKGVGSLPSIDPLDRRLSWRRGILQPPPYSTLFMFSLRSCTLYPAAELLAWTSYCGVRRRCPHRRKCVLHNSFCP